MDFDAILGMDWLSQSYAVVDRWRKKVTFKIFEAREEYYTHYIGNKSVESVKRGCSGYLAYVVDVGEGSPKLDDISMAQKFLDVFLEKLPSVHPEREIEFEINLIPGGITNIKGPLSNGANRA